MIIKQVIEIPAKLSTEYKEDRLDLKTILTDFVNSGSKYGQVIIDEDEYSGPESLRNSIRGSAARFGLPIKDHLRGHELYLSRTDI